MVNNQKSLGFFNRLFLVPKPNNNWRPILDLSNLNQFLKVQKFKMETPETIRTSLNQLQGRLLPHSNTGTVQEISEISRQTYQFKALPFDLSTAPMEFTVTAKEVKLMAIHKGIRIHQYLDDWLVRARSHQTCLQHTQELVAMCQQLGWLVNLEKSELEPKEVFDFVGYQFDLRACRVRPTTDRWQNLQEKIQILLALPACPFRQFMSLRSVNSHKKASSPWPTTYETHTVTSQKQLEGTHIIRKSDSNFQVTAPPPTMVTGGKQCASRSTITPNKTCSADLYRHIKRRVGHSLKRAHCKRKLVPPGKQAAYKLSGTKNSLSSLKRVSTPLLTQNSSGRNRQHHSGVIHKQRRHEVGPSVCPLLENLNLVYQEASDPQDLTHSRLAECGSGQAIQARPDHPNRVVTPSRGISNDMQQVAPSSDSQVQQQVASLSPVPDPLD